MAIEVFERVEKKYKLTLEQYDNLMKLINNKIELDEHGRSTICNIYLDTDKFDLIRTSIEKPIYKEKVRLRSYGTPNINSTVFLEIKKKYKGIVGKRRVNIKLNEFYDYLQKGIIPKCNDQIMKEIDYCIKFHKIKPKIFIAYDRSAYFGKEDKELRITFDTNLRYRLNNLYLELGDSDTSKLSDEYIIMEIKTLGSIPIWLVKELSKLKIYSTSFSKYGTIYEQRMEEF